MDEINGKIVKTFHCKDIKVTEQGDLVVLEMTDYEGNKQTKKFTRIQALDILGQMTRYDPIDLEIYDPNKKRGQR